MRLFLFLVGGTGSRVLRPLVMQSAAGIRPRDLQGRPMPLEIVPIIIDPHKANEDLKRTENLLRQYRQIRQAVYGDEVSVDSGFFATKISSLADVSGESTALPDTFVFNLGGIDSKTFREYISYNTLDSANQALMSLLFSEDQLETKMDIGFVGSPNMGSIAINVFKESEEFRQFASVFRAEDRVFVVSSIFGGTGAAGYPIIVKNIRNAASNNLVNNRGNLRDAKIGALTVLPYFNIQTDPKSPISRADFISKTKSALYYYHDNLTGLKEDGKESDRSKINVCYYLGDRVNSVPYFNDPGWNGQRNDAHLIEYVGALSVMDFLEIPDEELKTTDGIVHHPIFKEYGLASDKKTVSLKDLGLSTRQLVNRQWAKFHLAYLYLTNQFGNDIGRGYTRDNPSISRDFLTSTFYATLTSQFFVAYRQWLKELAGNQRSFVPFNLQTARLSDAITDVAPKSGLFKSVIDYKSVLSSMNAASQSADRHRLFADGNVARKLFGLLDTGLDKLCDEKYTGLV